MNNMENLLKELDELLLQSEDKKQEAETAKNVADIMKEEAEKKSVAADEIIVAVKEAQKKAKQAQKAYDKVIEKKVVLNGNESLTEEVVSEVPTEEVIEEVSTEEVVDAEIIDEESNQEAKNKKTNGKKIAIGVVCVFTAAALLAGGYVLGRHNVFGKKDNDDDKDNDKDSTSVSEEVDNKDNNSNLYFDYENNEILVNDNYVPLDETKFEELTVNFAKILNDKEVSIATDDIVKFAVVTNIDKLAEDSPELLVEYMGTQSKEEYLNDAANVIGSTVMYNYNVYTKTNNTEDFIKVSELVSGSQKENMLKIEEYTDKIADAVKANDKDLVNSLVSEFITDLNSGELSKLDNGVGFAAQVNIALISDVIARNYLNQENFDMLQILKTSEKYVSNIFTIYENCNNDKDIKTLTK